nr:hypothetical protein [Tanacetum cinerariifolium]
QTIKELPPTVQNVDPKYDLVHDSPNVFDPPSQLPFIPCEFCGNDARYGHYCTPQVPFVYLESCYNQDFNFSQDFHDFRQQDLCCENCEVTHEAYQSYNPSAKADYLSALQRLQNVNFSLIAELKSNKDASVDTIINLLRLDDAFAERLGLTESQPHANQLMVHIHHSLDQRVIALRDVIVPLSEPLSVAALEGTISPISTDDYEVAHADGQEGASVDGETAAVENINSFSDVADIPCSRKGVSIAVSKPTMSPGRKLVLQTLALSYLSILDLFLASCIAACSLFSSKRSKLMPKASLFLTMSTFAVLKVGMSISARITASAP